MRSPKENKKVSYRRENALPGGGLEATYSVHLRLNGKPVVDFLLVIIELFSLGVTVEVLRVNMDWKSPFLKGLDHFGSKFQVEEDVPHQPFVHS